MPLLLVVAAALLDQQKRVLLAERPAGREMAGLWEFPGGKIETNETPEQALARELKEELGLQVATKDFEPLTFASHAYPKFHLLMPTFVCRKWQGAPHAHEGQKFEWVAAQDIKKYPMPPADEPLVAPLLSFIQKI